MFNPKLEEFLKKDPDKKLISFAWSLHWRLTIVIVGIEIGIWVLFAIMASLLD